MGLITAAIHQRSQVVPRQCDSVEPETKSNLITAIQNTEVPPPPSLTLSLEVLCLDDEVEDCTASTCDGVFQCVFFFSLKLGIMSNTNPEDAPRSEV